MIFKVQRGRQWLKMSRVVPLATISMAAIVAILGILGVLKLTPPETVIITMLTLLSVDALTERITLLERIEMGLAHVPVPATLRNAEQKQSPKELGASASEILALGVSLVSWLPGNFTFFERKLKEGCSIRFLLLNPESPALEVWNKLNRIPADALEINESLKRVKLLQELSGMGDKVQVRLTDCFLPFAMSIYDPRKSTGIMHVEFYLYQGTMSERPHIILTRADQDHWFQTYVTQFERSWDDASEVPATSS